MEKRMLWNLLVATSLLGACAHGGRGVAEAFDGDPVVEVEQGTLRGNASEGADAFLGIPYAAPPTGNLRWRPPEPALPWQGVRDAKAFGKACVQTAKLGDGHAPVVGSEDCLFLNVWTPQKRTTPLPVMVWIHGGFSNWGAASVKYRDAGQDLGTYLYGGHYLAQHDQVVVVSLNYRLGPLGFLAHPALSAETAYGGSGNYGYMDQIAALKWVQKNIPAFGGDANRVTIFGESGGGTAVAALMSSPLAKGLFHRAIQESGAYVERPLKVAEKYGLGLSQALGCNDPATASACMRAKPAEELITAFPEGLSSGGRYYKFDVDGWVLRDTVVNTFRNHAENDVPFITGVNRDEAATLLEFFVPGDPSVQTVAQLRKVLYAFLKNTAGSEQADQMIDPAMRLYRKLYPASLTNALIAAASDYQVICPNRRFMSADRAHQSPTYRYLYRHVFHAGPLATRRAGHAVELPFVFHTFSSLPAYAPDAGELSLADQIEGYWTSFAATGDPNSPGAQKWPRYDLASDTSLALDERSAILPDGIHTSGCDFWDSFGSD
jgi:para-nitrobenzyl esterase